MDGRAQVTQDRARTARLHRGEEAALQRQVRVTHRVHAPIQAMQVPAPDARRDRVRAQPVRCELARRDDTPLLGSKARDQHVAIVELFGLTAE